MTKVTNKKNDPVDARKKRRHWYIQLLIFVIAQLTFLVLDDYSHWIIFNLNPLGEWVEANLIYLWEWVHIYEFQMFNLVTVTWGIVLVIYGIIAFLYTIFSKRGNH